MRHLAGRQQGSHYLLGGTSSPLCTEDPLTRISREKLCAAVGDQTLHTAVSSALTRPPADQPLVEAETVLLTLGLTGRCSFNAVPATGLGTLVGRGEGDKDEGEVKKSRDKREIRK